MMEYRRTNDQCLNCGGQFPSRIVKDVSGADVVYRCPDCHDQLVTGIYRQRDSEPYQGSRVPPPRLIGETMVIPAGRHTTWEAWWTQRMQVAAINGRVVEGNKELLEYVSELDSIYDS